MKRKAEDEPAERQRPPQPTPRIPIASDVFGLILSEFANHEDRMALVKTSRQLRDEVYKHADKSYSSMKNRRNYYGTVSQIEVAVASPIGRRCIYGISHISIGIDGVDVARLLDSIKTNKVIIHLNFSACGITSTVAKCIARFIEANDTIMSLDLSSNPRIGDDGVGAIFDALKVNKKLRLIDVCGTGITVRTAETILATLDHNKALISIHTCCNQVPRPSGSSIDKLLNRNRELQWHV